MTATIASLTLFLAVVAGGDAKLLDADFGSGIAPFLSDAPPRCENGSAMLEAGRPIALCANGPFVGDLVFEVAFAAPFRGEFVVRLPGAPDFESRFAPGGSTLRLRDRRVEAAPAAAATTYSLRVRSQAVEASADGVPFAFAEFDVPLGGGPCILEFTPSEPARLDAVSVSRLPFPDRDEVVGLDAERARRLASLPLEKFRLLDAAVSRLDPVFRIGVEGEAEEIVAKGRGLRPSEQDVPLLEQALALARIRPLLRFDLFEGEAQNDDPPLARREDGAFVITKKPGAIRVRSYCGVVGAWPVVVVTDVTRNRLLARLNPGGPSTGDAWALIPSKCERMRIALVVPDGPTIEHFVDLVRP